MAQLEPIAWQILWTKSDARLTIGYPWYFLTDITGEWDWLRIKASGRSACLGPAILECGVDGHPSLPLASDCLLIKDVAAGALIGKLGGSVASRSDGTSFAIGSQCVVDMPTKKATQLYIAINSAIAHDGRAIEDFEMEVAAAVAAP